MKTQDVNGTPTPSVFDFDAIAPIESATLEILRPDRITGTGWKITFAGPAHPKTIAFNNEQSRKNLRKASQIEQAQVNGKKFKSEDKDPDQQRRENAEWVVARILSWTPIKYNGDVISDFSESKALEMLVDPRLIDPLIQMMEFMNEATSFTPGFAKT